MAYVKQTWNNGAAGSTPISAARLAHMEDGIENPVDSIPDGTYVPYVVGLDRTGANAAANTVILQAALDAGGIVRVDATPGTIAHTGLTVPHGTVFQGPGRGSGVVLKCTNAAGGHGVTTAAAVRSATVCDWTMEGVADGGDLIHITANFGGIRLVALQLTDAGRDAVNSTEGDGIDLYMDGVRADFPNRIGFNIASVGVPLNTLISLHCYCTGAVTGSGWELANILSATLVGPAADNNATYGYVLSGVVTMYDGTSENNATAGTQIPGVGTVNFRGYRGINESPLILIAAAANVDMENVSDSNNLGSNSLVLTAAATGTVGLGRHGLTQAINVDAAASLTRRDAGQTFDLPDGFAIKDAPATWVSAQRVAWNTRLDLGDDLFTAIGQAWQARLGYIDGRPGLRLGLGNVIDVVGAGSPEGVVTADVGSTFRRTDGGAGTSLYQKESGVGNTGWVAK